MAWLRFDHPHLPTLNLPPAMANLVPHGVARFYRPNARPVPGPGGSIRAGGAVLKREMTLSLVNKGLLNPSGENNCFLNSAVQVLWHIDVFRRSFRRFQGHFCVGKACIFCALKELFTQIQYSDQSALPPDTLRRAMAECYEEEHRFQLGLMDDAAECFETLLENLHFHLTGNDDLDSCSVAHCLSHQKFALTVLERTECECGATSEPLSFVQFVHYISATALVAECQRLTREGHLSSEPAGQANFGKVLRATSSLEYKECSDADCNRLCYVKRILLDEPDVVCIGLIWDSDQPAVSHINNVLQTIGLTLTLMDAFDYVSSDQGRINEYQLSAIVAYYGRHYSTFCYHSALKEWVYFDDAKFRKIGTEWSEVVELCRKAHYQPLLLVYSNPFAEPIDTSAAPQQVCMVSAAGSQAKGNTDGDKLPTVSEDEGNREEEIARSDQTTLPTLTSTQASAVVSTDVAVSEAGCNHQPPQPSPSTQLRARKSPSPVVPPPVQSENDSFVDLTTFSIRPTRAGTGIELASQPSGLAAPTHRVSNPTLGSGQANDLMLFSISPASTGKLSKPSIRPTASQEDVPKPESRGNSPISGPSSSRSSPQELLNNLNVPSTALARDASNPAALADDLIRFSGSPVKLPQFDRSMVKSSALPPSMFVTPDQNLKGAYTISQQSPSAKRPVVNTSAWSSGQTGTSGNSQGVHLTPSVPPSHGLPTSPFPRVSSSPAPLVSTGTNWERFDEHAKPSVTSSSGIHRSPQPSQAGPLRNTAASNYPRSHSLPGNEAPAQSGKARVVPMKGQRSSPPTYTPTKTKASPLPSQIPIGEDPLYAVPSKLKVGKDTAVVAKSNALAHTRDRTANDDALHVAPTKSRDAQEKAKTLDYAKLGGGVSPRAPARRSARASSVKEGLGRAGSGSPSSRSPLSLSIVALPASSRAILEDAMNEWAKAEASLGSDDAVALMLYSQTASLLHKVLSDKAVARDSALYSQIQTRRGEALRKVTELRESRAVAGDSRQGREQTRLGSAREPCTMCGHVRRLDEHSLCGPCGLKVKVAQS